MNAYRVYRLTLLFTLLSALFVASCGRKSGCPAIDRTVKKKVTEKNRTQLFGKQTRKKM